MPSPSTAPSLAADPRTPNLFIIGAPKSGTTFVHHALDLVPTVYMSSVKEPGYFTSTRDQRRGLGYYLDAYFAKAAGYAVRGESTPWYLYSDLARRQIACLPAAEPPKLLVLLRRPSARALSMYLDQRRLNRDGRSFVEAVEAELAGLEAGHLHSDVRNRYVWGGLYSDHITRWRDQFGPPNLHVVVLEELVADTGKAWHELATFLDHDLGPSRLDDVSEHDRNLSGTLRWPRVDAFLRSFEGREHVAVESAKRLLPPGLHRRVLQQIGRLNRTSARDDETHPDEATLKLLDGFYQPEVLRLEALLERSLGVWSSPSESQDGRDTDVVVERAPAPPVARPTAPPIRVMHLVARSHRRGAELVAVELAEELDRLGLRNHVVALGPAANGRQEEGLVPLSPSHGVGLLDLVSRVRKVRELLADEPVDVVLAHGGWAAQVVALAAPRGGPVLVWQRILGFPSEVWQPGRRWWWRAIARRFDAGVALTADLEVELRRLGFDRPVWIIQNSRQPDRFVDLDRAEATARLRAEVGVIDGVPLIGFVGHLVHQKRPERALEVLARVLDEGCPAHLVVAGDGGLRPALEREVRARGLGRSVTFLGHRPDVQLVLGGVELDLLTSDAEGIPGVAIECLMSGCPVVTFPVGGVAEVVEDGVTGVIVPRHDPALMARAVIDLLGDDARRQEMGRQGQLRTGRFSAAATARVYADRLDALVSSR